MSSILAGGATADRFRQGPAGFSYALRFFAPAKARFRPLLSKRSQCAWERKAPLRAAAESCQYRAEKRSTQLLKRPFPVPRTANGCFRRKPRTYRGLQVHNRSTIPRRKKKHAAAETSVSGAPHRKRMFQTQAADIPRLAGSQPLYNTAQKKEARSR